MPLFDRVASLTIGPAGEEGIKLEGFRIVFDIKKTINPTKNTAKIVVYNLSETTRNKINTRDDEAILRVGHSESAGERLIFIGGITKVNHKHVPPDVQTTIEVGDGSVALRESRISESFAAGVSVNQVVGRLASELGVAVKEITGQLSETFANGLSVAGPVKDALDRMADKAGAEWSIQNNELQFITEGSTTQDDAILLSPETGLIASPEKKEDDAGALAGVAKPSGFVLNMILNPLAMPGRKVLLSSASNEGPFRIDSLAHKGDTHGDDWNTSAEVSEL